MAKNIGGGRKGQILNRYQLWNALTELWDKYDSNGNFMKTKKSSGTCRMTSVASRSVVVTGGP